MISTLIWDLSEVLINGVLGVEYALADYLNHPDPQALGKAFGSPRFKSYMRGQLTENEFLLPLIAEQNWEIELDTLKNMIRTNFHTRWEANIRILMSLSFSDDYQFVLLSDHGREWIDYILKFHEFLSMFDHFFYSFDIGALKKEGTPFTFVLNKLGVSPESCLFFDDHQSNIEVARTYGIAGICVQNPQQLETDIFLNLQ